MSDIENVTQRVLRDIQRELADMRDDRTVMIAILNRLDASVTSLNTEMRALRSQFDRFRNEVRERLEAPAPQPGTD
jgi:peptidoglycan hydrolase CwlO-like protein